MRHNRLAHLRQVERDWVEAAKRRDRVLVAATAGNARHTEPRVGTLIYAGPHGGACRVQIGDVRLTIARQHLSLIPTPPPSPSVVRQLAGQFGDCYPPGHLAALRDEWPS